MNFTENDNTHWGSWILWFIARNIRDCSEVRVDDIQGLKSNGDLQVSRTRIELLRPQAAPLSLA